MAPRLGYASGEEKAQGKSRNQLAPWRQWYKTTRWTKLWQVILRRDLYTCQMCGPIYAMNFETIPLLVVVTVWYLVLTTLATLGQIQLERTMNRGF